MLITPDAIATSVRYEVDNRGRYNYSNESVLNVWVQMSIGYDAGEARTIAVPTGRGSQTFEVKGYCRYNVAGNSADRLDYGYSNTLRRADRRAFTRLQNEAVDKFFTEVYHLHYPNGISRDEVSRLISVSYNREMQRAEEEYEAAKVKIIKAADFAFNLAKGYKPA